MLISVIIPCFNCKATIVDTIESVLIQEGVDVEIIIVDDCSSDDSFSFVKGLYGSDDRFVFCQNSSNLGVGATRNKGFDLSKGDYIALLDSDDIWERDKSTKQLDCLISTKADICSTGARVISYEGEDLGKLRYVDTSISLDKMLKNNMVINSSVLMKREVMEKIKFNAEFFHEDYVFWLEALQNNYKLVGIDEPLIRYRLGGRSKNKVNAAKARWDIYRRYMKLGVGKSLYYMWFYGISALKKN